MSDHRRRWVAVALVAGLAGLPLASIAADDPTASGPADSPPAASTPPGSGSSGAPASEAPAGDLPSPASPPAPGDQDHPGPTPSPDAAKNGVQPPKNLEPIPRDTAVSVLGRKVLGPQGEDMGRVVDLLLDRDAHLQAVVIDFGGFLGVGSRKIAIDWRLVRFVPDNRDAPLALALGKAEVQAAPEYKDSAQPPMMIGPQPSGSDAAR